MNEHKIGRDTAAWIKDSIRKLIDSDENIHDNRSGERVFGKPLIGFSRGDDPIFDTICELGQEYGATTGRKRQVNWMEWELLEKAVKINGVTHLVVNKMDILSEIQRWSLFCNKIKHSFPSEQSFKTYFEDKLGETGISIYFSGDKGRI